MPIQRLLKLPEKTIGEIFAEDGEPAFRKLEAETIQQVLQHSSGILATGGGAILNAQTCHNLQQAGPVVWLQATVTVLSKRIADDSNTEENRPRLTNTGVLEEIEQVLVQREPLYRNCATFSVDTSSKEIEEMLQRLSQSCQTIFRLKNLRPEVPIHDCVSQFPFCLCFCLCWELL